MELSRHVIRIKDQDWKQVLAAISSQENFVVVSVASPAVTAPMAFSHDSLQTLLAGAPEYLYLDVLPPDQYREWAANHIARKIANVEALRSLLRTNRAAEAGTEVRDFVADIEELVLWLASYTQQAACAAVAGQVEELRHATGRLTDACFKHEDNVRCMDSLHYEILPPLKKLQRLLEK